ncbi:MAG: 4a-hydroxytetrahydrobiopterin dehydratase [Deltaproteobacteria bacterium]|nr:4a-hydroxytetrahydrobiopterin dehydratase [Deltaproteobacteria bacterium]
MSDDFKKNHKPEPLRLREQIQNMPGWQIKKERLEKIYQFEDFSSAIIFVNKLVNPIEENQNYPRLLITYNRVFVSLFTNQAGGVTLLDLDMAKEFDALAGAQPETKSPDS